MGTKHERSNFLNLPIMEFSGITVDEEGNWFYQGNPIIREDILRLFYEHLRLIPGDGYAIEWQNALHPINVADTPFVITRVDVEKSDKEIKSVWITLKHTQDKELLNPSTIFVGKDNVLYCRIKNDAFIARFSRPAYYQLAELLEEENGEFVIKVGGIRYVIKVEP